MSDPLVEITKSTVCRYSDRFKSLGYDVRTLGWGSEEQQRMRFAQVLHNVDIRERSVLDVGCGFGDLKTFCDETGRSPSSYIGWDINPDLIKAAGTRHPDANFSVVDILNASDIAPTAQIGVMLGLLNFNLKETYNNNEYSERMIRNAFQAVTETLIVDFLSTQKTPDYPSEDFVFYHDPAKVIEFALQITPNVSLFHDYVPIPQKEFMIVMTK